MSQLSRKGRDKAGRPRLGFSLVTIVSLVVVGNAQVAEAQYAYAFTAGPQSEQTAELAAPTGLATSSAVLRQLYLQHRRTAQLGGFGCAGRKRQLPGRLLRGMAQRERRRLQPCRLDGGGTARDKLQRRHRHRCPAHDNVLLHLWQHPGRQLRRRYNGDRHVRLRGPGELDRFYHLLGRLVGLRGRERHRPATMYWLSTHFTAMPITTKSFPP